MDNNRERIRCVLRERRIELSLTQKEVAERAEIKLQQYQKFEGGERNVTMASFDVVCRVIVALELDISAFYLEHIK